MLATPSSGIASAAQSVAPEDLWRAHLYRLFAALLGGPATSEQLSRAAALVGDESRLGRAIGKVAAAAGHVTPQVVDEQYQTLFIGLGRGEFIPYGSYYLTGFLHEKPLARLREEMSRLGVERSVETAEPEDHIASLMEMMAGLVDGSYGDPLPLAEQKRFFDAHLGSWGRFFFRDLAAVKSSEFYAALGAAGQEFLAIEESAFEMA